MKHSNEEKEDLYALIIAELKSLGVKVSKVKKYKSGCSKQEKNPTEFKAKIFGIGLSEQEWISEKGYTLPKFLAVSTAHLGAYTQVEIGLFRKAGSVARQRDLRAKLENGGNLDGSEPNDVASLLKQWLRELPEPVIPCYLHDLFVRCQGLTAEDVRLVAVLLSCFLLPAEHLFTLKHLIYFLSEIASNSEVNKMVPHNLAVIMAPNLLSSSCDRAGCKSGSDLVHCYTSLVELLILNAEKIGQIPNGISSKLSLKLGEFAFSIETIDCSPFKCKKKRRSGGVIDIVSGIRRLVGGNLTPINNLMEGPDVLLPNLKVNSAFTSETRSALKRKADLDICPYTDVIKKQIFPDAKSIEHETPLLTPVGKTRFVNSLATPVTVCTPVTRNRRKSFGLLKKKQQKKGKLVTKGHGNVKHINHLLSVPCNSVCGKNELDISHESENKSCKMDTLSVPKLVNLSPMIISYKSSPFLRVENPVIKRTQSDCPMSSQKNETVSLCKLISASHEDLRNKKLSNTATVKHRSPRKCNSSDRSPAHGIRHMSPRKRESRVKHNDSKHRLSSQKRNSIKRSHSTRSKFKKSPILNEIKVGPITLDLLIKSTEASLALREKNTFPSENCLVSPSKNISSKIDGKYEEKQPCRNVASFSPNAKLYSETEKLLELKTPDTKGDKLLEICELKKTSPSAKIKAGFKKGVNKSSLKRGRPNTVKTGLPSDLCPKYSTDSISTLKSDINNKMGDFKSSHQKSNSASLLNEEFVVEDNVFDDMDVKKSLSNEIEACVKEVEENISFYDVSTNTWLNLTPLESKQYDVSISFTDVSFQEKEIDASPLYINTNKNQSLDINENNNLGNFCIKNRRSERLSKTYSHENLLDKRVIKSKPKKRNSSTHITNLIPHASEENVKCKVIVNESENLTIQSFEKENEEIWVNAENFLNTHLQPITPSENPAACKRESILQLMVRNAGKVQENVHHFNYMSVGSTPHRSDQISNLVSTSSNNSVSSLNFFEDKNTDLLENTLPSFKQHLTKSEDRISRKRLQSLKINNEFNLTCSESKLSKLEKDKKVRKSAMPLPPKFVNSVNICPNRGCPLKEVTNTNISKENLVVKKISKINSPIGTRNATSVNKKLLTFDCSPLHDNDLSIQTNKHSRYSSSSIDSSKSMGIRSDSSPILNKVPHLNEFSPKSPSGAVIRPLQGHSQSFNSTHFYHTKKRSIATLPRQSLSNAMMESSNQLYDEWECDM